MCFARVNIDSDRLQSDQERLNRIYAKYLPPSRVIRPADFVLALPMIAQIDREKDSDRNFCLTTFGIDFEHAIQNDHVLPSSEAKGRNGNSSSAVRESKSCLLPAGPAPRRSTDGAVLSVLRIALVLGAFTTPAWASLE
jgi:hypothetical protein